MWPASAWGKEHVDRRLEGNRFAPGVQCGNAQPRAFLPLGPARSVALTWCVCPRGLQSFRVASVVSIPEARLSAGQAGGPGMRRSRSECVWTLYVKVMAAMTMMMVLTMVGHDRDVGDDVDEEEDDDGADGVSNGDNDIVSHDGDSEMCDNDGDNGHHSLRAPQCSGL